MDNEVDAAPEAPAPKIEDTLRIKGLPDKYEPLQDRGISEATAKRYRVGLGTGKALHVYPYFDKDGVHVANKIRYRDKEFAYEGERSRAGLFGQQLFPPGSAKYITLTEGECDAMAAYEIMGSQYPVVSVHGSTSAAKDCANQFEYLNSFDNIVIAFDKDEAKVSGTGMIHYPGQEAALAVANMFQPGKVKVLTFQEFKDANDYLLRGRAKEFMKEWWAAPRYTPAGLKLGKDMWDEIKTPKKFESFPYPWQSLNEKTYGIRLSEFVIVTGETGDGKTSILKEIEHSLIKGEKSVGIMHFEEPNDDTGLGLMSITANRPLHLPDVREQVSDVDLKRYFDETLNTDHVVIWDHFGSNNIHEVLAKVRHMHALGCKYIIIDHLSIIVSDQSGDERKQLDEISTKLKMLCMELNIAVIAVIHQNRNGQIRGTAGVEQLANIVIKINREKEDPDDWRRNVSKLVVQKNRFSGRTGPGVYLFYEATTGRLNELDKQEIANYEAGGNAARLVTGQEKWVASR